MVIDMVLFSFGLIAIVGGLIATIILQQSEHAKLTKGLVDRIMAGTLREYEQVKNPPPPRVVVKNDPPEEDLNRILG